MTPAHVVVVGGGIAGLTTAYRVREKAEARALPVRVTLVESAGRVGGNIRTEHVDGFTVEWGPNGFLDNVPSTLRLAGDLGIAHELQRADERAATRFLWRGGRLHPLPSGPGSFLRSPLLSVPGRLRVLSEPLRRKGRTDLDESVRDFAVRRIGAEAADVLVDAMVSGVFAGDAARLSLPSAFPKMRAMEAEHGSLVRAMVARARTRRREGGAPSGGGPAGPGGTLTSFRDGMQRLPEALAGSLDGEIRTGCAVRTVRRSADGRAWKVVLEDGEALDADEVVFAVPGRVAGPLLEELDPILARELGQVSTAGLAVVALGLRSAALEQAPDGFGFLVPRSEGLRMLGCLRDSSIFPGRAPDDRVLLRVMIGGAHDPEAVGLGDAELLDTVLRELRTTLGVSDEPEMVRIVRHPLGIAQYTVGHGGRLESFARRLERLPGLSLSGSGYRGVAMNACVETAERDAETICARLATSVKGAGHAVATSAGTVRTD